MTNKLDCSFLCKLRAHILSSVRAFTRINANAVSYVRLRACSRVGLIKTQNTFACKKKSQNSKHFGFRNFQDILYCFHFKKACIYCFQFKKSIYIFKKSIYILLSIQKKHIYIAFNSKKAYILLSIQKSLYIAFISKYAFTLKNNIYCFHFKHNICHKLI